MELGRYGVWCSLEGGSLAAAVEAAQRIEALGYSTLWQPMALRRGLCSQRSGIEHFLR